MRKHLYIELLEAEVDRLRKEIQKLRIELRDKDPLAKGMAEVRRKMSMEMYGQIPPIQGLSTILKEQES